MKETILCVSDLHSPFMHSDTVKFLTHLKSKYKPTKIVFIGDILDHYMLSQFKHSTKSQTAAQELTGAIESLFPIYKLFPEAYLVKGNHDNRFEKIADQAGIPGQYLKEFKDTICAPKKWQFVDEVEIDGILFTHGDGYTSQSWTTITRFTHKNTVIGHTHANAGLIHSNNLWALNVGCLIDDSSYAFHYARTCKIRGSLGCGVIQGTKTGYIPMWIPLNSFL